MQAMTTAAAELTPAPVTKLARKVGKRKAKEPTIHDDPRIELRRLVEMHRTYTNHARSVEQWTKDIKWRATGEIIKCKLAPHVRTDAKEFAKRMASAASSLETAMLVQLRQVPVYDVFLKHVYGVGPVVAAYLVSMVKIEKCPNVSNLIRYCGNAVDFRTGKREIRSSAPKADNPENFGTYNDELKMRIWQAMVAMRKNGAKVTEDRPFGTTTKYLDRWAAAVHTRRTDGRALGAEHAGRRKATDLFLWDLYVMMRTLDGLTIRPDKYSAIRGRYHNGQEARDALYTLTLPEALAMVGDVKGRAATAVMFEKAVADEDAEVEATH